MERLRALRLSSSGKRRNAGTTPHRLAAGIGQLRRNLSLELSSIQERSERSSLRRRYSNSALEGDLPLSDVDEQPQVRALHERAPSMEEGVLDVMMDIKRGRVAEQAQAYSFSLTAAVTKDAVVAAQLI